VLDLAQVLRNVEVDFLVMTAEEFLAMEDQGLAGPLLVSHVKQRFTEEYILVTHVESAIRSVADLMGRSLILAGDSRSSLARRWLEVLCHEHGLPAPEEALRKFTFAAKATQVVLPVFFRKADACIVTRHGLEIMAEMNPQVKKQLRILAGSPPLVPSLSCFRRGFSDARKQELLEATLAARGRPAFEQVMILFKGDGLLQQPVSVLDSARELLATHARLFGPRNGEPVGWPAADPLPAGGKR
jgi:ABC-type phosphate/phosphonate transport system substrate-binding protein